ncbi:MAG: DUF1598 domain-containing protein [Pirellulales bacterium]
MSNRFAFRAVAFLVSWCLTLSSAYAQFGNQQVGNAPQQNAVFGPALGVNAAGNFGNGQGNSGSSGGAASADFDSLIDLITSTVAQDTWAENGGGEAEIRPFPTGVLVDAAGTLKLVKSAAPSAELAGRRVAAPPASSATSADARRASKLRFVSLPRLEREIIRRQSAHEKFDPTMLTLAGLQRVEYVFVCPESNDLVLAGPAGDWQIDPVGRILSADTGAPVIRLDDLLTLLRRSQQSKSSFFGCMINPRQAALAATQTVLDKSAQRPLEPGRRKEWLEEIRSTLGRQDVEIFGIDPTSRVARVLVEADVHMKLIGMGLEDGVPGVESYLDSAKQAQRAGSSSTPSAMAVLRWWFALNYVAIQTSADGNAFQLVGDGVRVLSENEALAAQGQRIHTGQSDPLNQQFADSFTAHVAQLSDKYPIYGELRTIFDLSLALALIDGDHLAERAHWKPSRFLDNEKLRLPQMPAPREVDTVANCVVVNRRQVIAGVSGGVMVDSAATLANRIDDSAGALARIPRVAPRKEAKDSPITWWWDAATSR